MEPLSLADTGEFKMEETSSGSLPPRDVSARIQVDLAGLSHRGHVRPNNEDAFLIVRFGRHLESLASNLPAGWVPERSEEVGYGLIVADGMGGMAAGEVASRTAVSQLIELVLDTPDWLLRLGEQEMAAVMRRFAERFAWIGASLREQARSDPSLAGMGTTLTGAISLGPALMVLNVGDSRAYLCRDGELYQLTRDHTLAQELADRGMIGQEETATHRSRHVLTRALGGHDDQGRAEAQRLTLADGDQLLICSDGLNEMVDDAGIHDILRSEGSAREACQALVDSALKKGGKDNVTVVLARYHCPVNP